MERRDDIHCCLLAACQEQESANENSEDLKAEELTVLINCAHEYTRRYVERLDACIDNDSKTVDMEGLSVTVALMTEMATAIQCKLAYCEFLTYDSMPTHPPRMTPAQYHAKVFLERIDMFMYSLEANTPPYKMPDQTRRTLIHTLLMTKLPVEASARTVENQRTTANDVALLSRILRSLPRFDEVVRKTYKPINDKVPFDEMPLPHKMEVAREILTEWRHDLELQTETGRRMTRENKLRLDLNVEMIRRGLDIITRYDAAAHTSTSEHHAMFDYIKTRIRFGDTHKIKMYDANAPGSAGSLSEREIIRDNLHHNLHELKTWVELTLADADVRPGRMTIPQRFYLARLATNWTSEVGTPHASMTRIEESIKGVIGLSTQLREHQDTTFDVMDNEHSFELAAARIDVWTTCSQTTTNPTTRVKPMMRDQWTNFNRDLTAAATLRIKLGNQAKLTLALLMPFQDLIERLREDGDELVHFVHEITLYHVMGVRLIRHAYACRANSLITNWLNKFYLENLTCQIPWQGPEQETLRNIRVQLSATLFRTQAALDEDDVSEDLYERLRNDVVPYLEHGGKHDITIYKKGLKEAEEHWLPNMQERCAWENPKCPLIKCTTHHPNMLGNWERTTDTKPCSAIVEDCARHDFKHSRETPKCARVRLCTTCIHLRRMRRVEIPAIQTCRCRDKRQMRTICPDCEMVRVEKLIEHDK